jgi:hypothetical protein
MPQGPQRQKPKTPRGPNKVEGVWRGGPNYSDQPERETFRSQSHARQVMQSRASGWDPIQGLKTPVVQDSQMELYRPGSADPFLRMSQTNRGIRRERF